jgi:hypothetical protein
MVRGVAPDLTGVKRGHLTVIRRNGSDQAKNALWLCKCECGKKVSIRAMYLKEGKQQFCSKQCPLYTVPMRIDIKGKRFGRLVALSYVRSSPGGMSIWAFRCDCGKKAVLKHDSVLSGHTKSCGCYGKESRVKHGKSQTLEYHREAHRKWAKANPEKVIANAMRRTKAKRVRIPKWLTDEHWDQIAALYAKAQRLTLETGIKHHVDHIYPLRGKLCSGLHVPWNLQVSLADVNLRKANKMPLLDDVC